MKHKRDIQGKFTLKDEDYRQVLSLRLTDDTWKAWGIAAECLGLSRADLLEKLVKQNGPAGAFQQKVTVLNEGVYYTRHP